MKSILFFVTLILSALTHAADLPRVAVVPDSPEASVVAFADFLSVSLASSSNQYALVERAEITRLASEAEMQKLAADQRPTALAKLAKADGLIIVGTDQSDPKLPKLTLRLTSTNNGLVLRSLILGGKQDEYPKAAELAAGVLRFPCERLTHGDMKPPVIISLLGIRPSFEKDRSLESTLNLSVGEQLSASGGVAVSERWRMNDLVFERSLDGVGKTAKFATGTVLMDGSYDRAGDEIRVEIRLRSGETDTGRKFVVSGPAVQPSKLAARIVEGVRSAVESTVGQVAWDPVREGKEFASLAEWLLFRKLAAPAAQAAETSVALGYLGKRATVDRTLAYQQLIAQGASYDLESFGTHGWEKLPFPDFHCKVMLAIRHAQCVVEMQTAKWGGMNNQEYIRDHRHINLLESVGLNMQVLQSICQRKEQTQLASEARTIRALTRDICAKGEAELRNTFPGEMVHRMYMFETPADAIQEYREILSPKNLSNLHWSKGLAMRNHLWQLGNLPGFERVVDWSSTDNAAGRKAWSGFVSELVASPALLARVDACAMAIQCASDQPGRERAVNAYGSLLEKCRDEWITEQGQMTFHAFRGFIELDPYKRIVSGTTFEERLAGVLCDVFSRAEWVHPATIELSSAFIRKMSGRGKGDGEDAGVSEALAREWLEAIERYLEKAQKDKRWKSQYANRSFGDPVLRIRKLPELLIHAYPAIRDERLVFREPVVGAVPIHVCIPGQMLGSTSPVFFSGDSMISWGESGMILATQKDGICILDMEQMRLVNRFLMPGPSESFHAMAAASQSLVVNWAQRLYRHPLLDAGGAWQEITISGTNGDHSLNWNLSNAGDEVFVGSTMIYNDIEKPQMLAGFIRGGSVDWRVNSNRRPPVNPSDRMHPGDVLCSYQTINGETVMLVREDERFSSKKLLCVGSGKEIAKVAAVTVIQLDGEMPLGGVFHDERIQHLVAFDPAGGKPLLLFKPKDHFYWSLPPEWVNVSPIHSTDDPAFHGHIIAAIACRDHLWILKREPDEVGRTRANGPNDFRLVRVALRGGRPIVIPLALSLTDGQKNYFGKHEPMVGWPIINMLSLRANRRGLYFTPGGGSYGFRGTFHRNGIYSGGTGTPAILHLDWKDIDAWLAKNAPEFTKSASP